MEKLLLLTCAIIVIGSYLFKTFHEKDSNIKKQSIEKKIDN